MEIKKRMRSVLICLLAAAMLLAQVLPAKVSAASSGEIKAQINQLENEKAELEAQMEALEQQMVDNLSQIEDTVAQKMRLDEQIFLLHQQIANINEQISAYGVLIADQQDALDAAEARYAQLSEQNRERVRAMEEDGTLSYWSVLFKANSLSDLLDRLNMIEEINASDQRRLQELSEAAMEVEQTRLALEAEKANLETTKTELDESQATLCEKQAESAALLVELNAKGEEYEALMAEQEALEEQFMLDLAQMQNAYNEALYQEWLATSKPPETQAPKPTESTGGNTPESTGNSGEPGSTEPEATKPAATEPPATQPPSDSWRYPLPYRVPINDPFGMRESHPVYGDTRMHNGVDLGAPRGTAIYAARNGVVSIASYNGSCGYYVQIDHSDGFRSIYMHMTNYIVSSGQYVTAGQTIGYVGDSGATTGPHLHFGISKNGTYVNPMNYI